MRIGQVGGARLDAGESEAIALALELNADLLLIMDHSKPKHQIQIIIFSSQQTHKKGQPQKIAP